MKRIQFSIGGIIFCSFLALTSGAQTRDHATSPSQGRQDPHAMGSSPCAWWTTAAVGNSPAAGNSLAVGNSPVQKKDANADADISGIVNGLRSAGFTCGVFVIEGTESSNSYSTFQKLLDATKDTNIKLWVVIIPPSEGADSLPYRSDYVAWSRALAELSLKYKNFRGFNIDDIDQDISVKTFTHDYVCKIYAAKRNINPRLLFVPTVYDLDRSVADRLTGCLDGVWLWWVNLEKSTGMPSFLENSRLATEGRFPIYGGVYARWTSWHGVKEENPKPDVFQQVLEDSCKYSDGAIIWQLSLAPDDPLLAVTKEFLPGGSSPYAGKCGSSASGAKR